MTTFPSGGEGERKLQPMRSVAEEDYRRGVTAGRKKKRCTRLRRGRESVKVTGGLGFSVGVGESSEQDSHWGGGRAE